MQFSNLITATVLAMSTLASARCYGGSNQSPDNKVGTIEAIMLAAIKMSKAYMAPNDEVWSHSKVGDVCLNYGIKNQSGRSMSVSTEDAIDALAREWVGCEHGGERKYDSGLLFV